MKNRIFVLSLIGLVSACSQNSNTTTSIKSNAQDTELRKKAAELFSSISDTVQINGKAPEEAKVQLGQMLFFDPRLSKSGTISCNSCHNVGMGGVDGMPTSVGHSWQKGGRNSPTVYNAVFNATQFWDGRAKDLQEQAKGPIQNPIEMANTKENVEATLKSIPEYVQAFKQAFPNEQNSVNFENVAISIANYEATLTTPNSKFDKFLKGDDAALDVQEKAGLNKFIDNGCAACHKGANFGGQDFFKFGVVNNPAANVRNADDHGKMQLTKDKNDDYVFRVAPLRNASVTAPYFHTGNVWKLEEAVKIMGHTQLGVELAPDDVAQITSFIKSLNGDMPKTQYPKLPPHADGTPLPNTK